MVKIKSEIVHIHVYLYIQYTGTEIGAISKILTREETMISQILTQFETDFM